MRNSVLKTKQKQISQLGEHTWNWDLKHVWRKYVSNTSHFILQGYWCDVTIVNMLVPIERLILLNEAVTYYIRTNSMIYTGHLILLFWLNQDSYKYMGKQEMYMGFC